MGGEEGKCGGENGWGNGCGVIRTILFVHPGPDPAGGFVDHDVSHAVLFPLAQDRDDLFSGSEFGDLEAQYLSRGLDVQEPQQPVLVLGLNGSRRMVRQLVGRAGVPVIL